MSTDSRVVVTTDALFDQFVADAPAPVLVDFWAPWCEPCKQLRPTLEAVANDFGDKVIVATLNVDENSRIPSRHNVRGIPQLLLFKGKLVVEVVQGLISKDQLIALITPHVT